MPYYVLIGIASTQGNEEGKEAVVSKALEINPASFLIRERYLNTLKPRWGGSYEKMLAFVGESMPFAASNALLKLLEGVVYADAADMQERTQKYTVARDLYTKALTYGESYKILKSRARVLAKMEMYEEALQDINRAIELNPEDAMCYFRRSDIYSDMGKYYESVPDIKTAKLLAPGDEDISKRVKWLSSKLVSEGFEQNKQKNYLSARQHYDAAIELNQNDAEGYYWRVKSFIDQYHYDMALQDLKVAVELEKHNFGYYQSLDWVLAKRGEWDQIIGYWDRFIENNPEDGRAYVERGGAYFRKGDIESSMRDAKQAAEMGSPEGAEAYERYNYMLTPQGKMIEFLRPMLSHRWTMNILLSVLTLLVAIWILQKISAARRSKQA